MTIYRAWAVKALRKIILVKQSVQSLISKEITGLKASGHYMQPLQQPSQALFAPHPFLPPATPVHAYNPMSRTEDTIRQEQMTKKRYMDCPLGFVQHFVTADG